ncbi:MAG: hypothetical protein B0A82_08200 [Alkalinema sp. CACIAM 70d]|nr:MAG: hypothetical protein B0A82_08200 [Alkalinema sp. CACIAM 70d]
MDFSVGKLQRQWLIGFLLVSLLLPIIFATLLVAIGQASGCQMVGKTAQICLVKGINIGQTIKTLVDWTWYIPLLSLFQVPIVSVGLLIGLLMLVHKSFRGWKSALIGVFSIWFMCFAPSIFGVIFVMYLAQQAKCSLNEGGVGSCYLFGLDMGSTFHAAVMIPLFLIILFPLCTITSVAYIIITFRNPKRKT